MAVFVLFVCRWATEDKISSNCVPNLKPVTPRRFSLERVHHHNRQRTSTKPLKSFGWCHQLAGRPGNVGKSRISYCFSWLCQKSTMNRLIHCTSQWLGISFPRPRTSPPEAVAQDTFPGPPEWPSGKDKITNGSITSVNLLFFNQCLIPDRPGCLRRE